MAWITIKPNQTYKILQQMIYKYQHLPVTPWFGGWFTSLDGKFLVVGSLRWTCVVVKPSTSLVQTNAGEYSWISLNLSCVDVHPCTSFWRTCVVACLGSSIGWIWFGEYPWTRLGRTCVVLYVCCSLCPFEAAVISELLTDDAGDDCCN